MSLVQVALEIEAALPGQSHVEHEATRNIWPLCSQKFPGRFEHADPQPDRLEKVAQSVADRSIIVDYEHHGGQVGHPMRTDASIET